MERGFGGSGPTELDFQSIKNEKSGKVLLLGFGVQGSRTITISYQFRPNTPSPRPPLLSCPSTPASSCQTRPVGFSVQTMRMWCVPLQQEALIWSLSPKLYHPPALASRWPSRNFRLSQIGAHGRQHLGEGVPDSVIN